MLQLLLRHNITGESGSSPGKVLSKHLWILCRRPSPTPSQQSVGHGLSRNWCPVTPPPFPSLNRR